MTQTQPGYSQRGRTDSPAPFVWPRTLAGYCSCPYCTAIREGWLEIPKAQTIWAKRMGRPEVVR
jgi:hypothetical protein